MRGLISSSATTASPLLSHELRAGHLPEVFIVNNRIQKSNVHPYRETAFFQELRHISEGS